MLFMQWSRRGVFYNSYVSIFDQTKVIVLLHVAR